MSCNIAWYWVNKIFIGMIKRIYFSIVAMLFTVSSFAITPHGSRLDRYDRGYGSGDIGSGVLFVLVVIVAVILILLTSSNKK